DDMNDWVGGLGGHPQVKTPHIDRLAKRGLLFANANFVRVRPAAGPKSRCQGRNFSGIPAPKSASRARRSFRNTDADSFCYLIPLPRRIVQRRNPAPRCSWLVTEPLPLTLVP
ncbi:MAG: hypothetical protein FJ392_05390, partial [Verrucomicrobia bacterium]|nr:hypothetical protein [Verrucomicrobiota bacterium]